MKIPRTLLLPSTKNKQMFFGLINGMHPYTQFTKKHADLLGVSKVLLYMQRALYPTTVGLGMIDDLGRARVITEAAAKRIKVQRSEIDRICKVNESLRARIERLQASAGKRSKA